VLKIDLKFSTVCQKMSENHRPGGVIFFDSHCIVVSLLTRLLLLCVIFFVVLVVSSGSITINEDSSVQILAEEACSVDQLDGQVTIASCQSTCLGMKTSCPSKTKAIGHLSKLKNKQLRIAH